MFRKIMTTGSLIGLLLGTGLWVASETQLGFLCRHHGYLFAREDVCVTVWNGHITCIWGAHARRKMENLAEVIDGPLPGCTICRPRTWLNSQFVDFCARLRDLGGYWNSVRIPLWSPPALFSILPVYSLGLFLLRHKRKKRGLCLECGYDLRGSRERCPECGTKFDSDRPILKADR